jgi:hypothetical protein
MKEKPRVSALPRRRPAPSASYHADRSRISFEGKPSRPTVARITRLSGE